MSRQMTHSLVGDEFAWSACMREEKQTATESRVAWASSVLICLLLMLGNLAAQAHELRPTVADLTVTDDTIAVSMRLNLEALLADIGPEHSDSEDAPQAERYAYLRQLSPTALTEELEAYLPKFLEQCVMSNQSGTPLPLSFESVSIPETGDLRLPRDSVLDLHALRSAADEAVSWQWHQRYGAIILRADAPVNDAPAQSAVPDDLAVQDRSGTAGDAFTQYLPSGEKSDLIAIDPSASSSSGSTMVDYVRIGFQHIIPKGLDHILFVVGLFLLAPRLRPIAWQVSMFTLAHTLTLALGITGVIALPAAIVEPLIALSISVICLENLFGSRFKTRRLVIVFCFGLLHGLGFAGVLSDIGLVSGQFVRSLLAFNVGVELGQLAVVLLCFACVGWWFRNKPWYRTAISVPASVVIGAVGLYWFAQRIGM